MREISESVVSLGFKVASVTAGSAPALPSAASMTFLSTLAIRRVTTCAARRSVSVKTVKIEVKGRIAKLYVNGAEQPTLIVNDLKQPVSNGGIALWVGQGTIAHFADLNITP